MKKAVKQNSETHVFKSDGQKKPRCVYKCSFTQVAFWLNCFMYVRFLWETFQTKLLEQVVYYLGDSIGRNAVQ